MCFHRWGFALVLLFLLIFPFRSLDSFSHTHDVHLLSEQGHRKKRRTRVIFSPGKRCHCTYTIAAVVLAQGKRGHLSTELQ